MDEREWLAQRFEADRPRLRAVAYRMLGSLNESEDAVQEAWLRLQRSDAGEVENLSGWLTTVVARVCLDMLRTRTSRREQPLDGRIPDPVVDATDGIDPEHEALLADAVGLALLVVLDTLAPVERLAFVLHDMFAVPFDEIAPLVDRTPAAARQLASRARRRVRGTEPLPETDLPRQRAVVDAFLAAARGGDFDALISLLAPDIVLRVDSGAVPVGTSREIHGSAAVAGQALTFARHASASASVPVLVNGAAGVLSLVDGKPRSLLSFTVRDGQVTRIDILADQARIARLDLASFIADRPES
ncbi:sigma-70 family RNA polymerase sigma factor [Streptomyces zagrosensis]|uniref:RNA polymerase sigma-70 factor (ECF subfamily) n=1 Tax=Streptomyces zagrosensis TaxID=1042984 RepID=A0A7W9Q801_9ACTN|nr:sigma-70 family RNA polymerase sigma factor [Streptomyces zagrosensis]MBB5935288.1 RNA polymerase sigma-70 factor (ECF subfamily) [Streptomyces zagrosensis]